MDWLLDLWRALPDTAKGAVLGSFITLLGVCLASFFEGRRNKARLDHDAKQRALERDQNLKRDVFVGVVEGAADLLTALGRFADVSLEDSGNALREIKSGSFWKGHVVGRMETIEALQRIAQGFEHGLIDLLEVRADVEAASLSHKLAVQETEQLLQESARHKEFADGLSASGLGGTPAMTELLGKWTKTVEHMNLAFETRNTAQREMVAAQLRLYSSVADAGVRLQRALVEATPAVRRELGFEGGFDAAVYERMVIVPANESRRRLDQALERIRAKHFPDDRKDKAAPQEGPGSPGAPVG